MLVIFFVFQSGFTFSAPVVKTGLSLSNGKMVTPVVAAGKRGSLSGMEQDPSLDVKGNQFHS